MDTAMTHRILAALLLLAACGGSDDTTAPPTPGPMAGDWSAQIAYSGEIRPNMSMVWYPADCSGTIPLKLQDASGTLTGQFLVGTVHCDITDPTMPGWTMDLAWDTPVTGTRTASALSFTTPFCAYTGTQTGPSTASGTLHCTAGRGGVEQDTDGTWTATK